ncbi:DNA starvation/stationary phase protection protein DpsA [Haloplanus halophilus]|uniref:DNA starvation/stationary phase protection protein DpsA n=1 Tax=Haloplanus halophilus TaxID=2949993 RepID=UPI002041AC43|nr:DNA starvation/stationary phase protection protein DpsA [Haloplanus sp. GDY1]
MSAKESIRREAGSVEDNAVRIDTGKAEQVIEALNTDLAATYVLYHQLKKHHWTVEGAEFGQLHDWFGDAAEEAEENADEIAERVQALGGVPISGPSALDDHSIVEFEGEDVYDVRTAMENDMEMYGDIIESVRDHVSLAEDLGDYATGELLRETLEDLEEGAHEAEHFLEDDTLVLADATH